MLDILKKRKRSAEEFHDAEGYMEKTLARLSVPDQGKMQCEFHLGLVPNIALPTWGR